MGILKKGLKVPIKKETKMKKYFVVINAFTTWFSVEILSLYYI